MNLQQIYQLCKRLTPDYTPDSEPITLDLDQKFDQFEFEKFILKLNTYTKLLELEQGIYTNFLVERSVRRVNRDDSTTIPILVIRYSFNNPSGYSQGH